MISFMRLKMLKYINSLRDCFKGILISFNERAGKTKEIREIETDVVFLITVKGREF